MAKSQRPQDKKSQQGQSKQGGSRSDKIVTGEAAPGHVEEIIGRTGFRGEITQVKCKIIDGNESGKSLRRNVKGSIQLNDILMLRETDIEARRIRSKVTKGAFT